MLKALANAFKIPDLKKRLVYTLLMLVVFRVGTAIPVPGIKVDVIKSDTKEYTINGDNTPYNSYVYNMKITYKYDLGYDSEVEVIVVNKDNFMYVVEKN